jgi:hypothetical protein
LLAALRTTIRRLGHEDQLDDRAARSLDRLVRDAGRALGEGDVRGAQAKLRTVAETVSRLRADGDLSAAGYETITKAISAIERNLSQA